MSAWGKIHQLGSSRFFHQMLPIDETKFALVGGSHIEHGSHVEVEVYEVTQSGSAKNAGLGRDSKPRF